MKNMIIIEVENNDPNGTLSNWLSSHRTYNVLTIVCRKDDNGKFFWHIYCE